MPKTWKELSAEQKRRILDRGIARRALARNERIAAGREAAFLAMTSAYDQGQYKTARARTRAYNNDMRRKGPYARNIESYRPRKNDWPGVDDTGVLADGSRVQAYPYKWARVRSAPRAANPAFLAAAAARSAAARAQQGGFSKDELMKMAKAQGLRGRSKMTGKQLWLELGQPGSYVSDALSMFVERQGVKREGDDSGPRKRRIVGDYDD